MRVLVLNQYFHPDRSGTAQILTELCEDLARGHEVTVVAGRPSYDPVERNGLRGLVSPDQHDGVKVLRTWSTAFPRDRMGGRLANYATYLASSSAGVARAGKPDVVLGMTDPPLVSAVAAAAAGLRRAPFVFAVQDLFPETGVAVGGLPEGTMARGLRALGRVVRDRAQAVVVVGRDMRERLVDQGVPADKLHVIPNWADGTAIRPLERPSELRHSLGLDGSFVVEYSGNVGLTQDLGTLIGAAERLRDEPGIRFLVIGNGAAREGLEARARQARLGNVTFLDYRPREELADSLGAADLHIVGMRPGLVGALVPSKMYGVMAAGRPFIAAVEPGSEVALVVEESGCGFRVGPGDPSALAGAILELRAAPGRLAAMGAHGRSELERRYERRTATDAYRRVLEHVAADRTGAVAAAGGP